MSDFSPSSQNDPTPVHNNWRPVLPEQLDSPNANVASATAPTTAPPSAPPTATAPAAPAPAAPATPEPVTAAPTPSASPVTPTPPAAPPAAPTSGGQFAPPSPSTPEPEQPKRRWWPVVVALGVVALVVGGGAFALGTLSDDATPNSTAPTTVPATVAATTSPAPTEPQTPESTSQTTATESGILLSTGHASVDVHSPIVDVAVVADTISPSVVTVISDIESDLSTGATGTGVIVTADGNILTNAHVVADATAVRVLLNGETEPVSAEVLATDAQNDLALIDIDGSDHTPAVFADPDETRIGDPVVAMGFALGLEGGPTVTLGIVSAVNRTLEMENGAALDGLIQTDAAISSGNSGGPLVNAAGEVVGINTAVARSDAFTSASNVGFAISVDEVLQVVPVLRNQANGEIRENGYLGVTLERRTDGGQGALVDTVQPGTPAATAGLKAGDVVLDIDGSPINSAAGLQAAILDREPGEEIHITVLRDGAEVVLTAVLTDRPTEP